jgi:hypothetical protein
LELSNLTFEEHVALAGGEIEFRATFWAGTCGRDGQRRTALVCNPFLQAADAQRVSADEIGWAVCQVLHSHMHAHHVQPLVG